LKSLIEKHYEETGSEKAKTILSDFSSYIPKFKKIIPNDYLKIMTEIAKDEESGMSHEEASLDAFKKCTA